MSHHPSSPTEQSGTPADVHRELADLREANARFRALLDASTLNAIVASDPGGLITVFNTGAERMLGYTGEEMVGKQTPLIFHLASEIEARGATLSEKYGRRISGHGVFVEQASRGESEEREWTFVRKDGSRLIASVFINAMFDEQGKITGYVGIVPIVGAVALLFTTQLSASGILMGKLISRGVHVAGSLAC